MSLSNIYFAYKNYVNVDYGARWDLIKQLIKKHNVDERRDRIINKYVTEDIEESNILIKKGYYVLSFNNSEVSSVGQINDFYLHHTGIGCDICFDTGRCFPHYSDLHVIVTRKEDISRIITHVELQEAKASISKEKIFEKIKLRSPDTKKLKSADLFTLNKAFLLVQGTFCFSYGEGDDGYEYPYFGILLQNEDTLLIEAFSELLHVLLIDGKYYFATYWQEPECGKRGLMIYTVEGKSLEKVFSDHSEAT